MLLKVQKSRRRATIAVTGLATAGLLLAGCAPSGGGDAGGISVASGVIGDITENFNPFSPSVLQPTMGAIYEPLFFYNTLSTGEPEPMLGTEYSWNESGTELTITTRDGVKWADGEDFTADDVAFTFDLLAENEAINTIGYTGEAEAVDGSTVVVTFTEPSLPIGPDLIGRTAIVPEHLWSEYDDVANFVNSEPVGTGPYQLRDFTPQSYVLEKNDDYWQDGKPKLETVRYVSFASGDSALTALTDGTLDWNTGLVPDFEDEVEASETLNQINTPINQTAFIACANAELGCQGAQTDPAVRLAINYGIDRAEIIDIAFEGLGGAVSPSFLLPDRDADLIADDLTVESPSTADPDRAVQILEDAGYTRGADGIFEKNGQKVSVKVQVPQEWADYITAIDVASQQLAEVGIDLTADRLPGNQYSSNRFTGDFQFTMDGVYQGPSPDPYYIYSNYFTSGGTAPVGEQAGTNYSRWSDPEVDALVAQARVSLDEGEKKGIYEQIQRVTAEELPYIPVLVVPTVTYFSTDDATGWPTEDDLYAFPASWSVWNLGVVLANLEPAE